LERIEGVRGQEEPSDEGVAVPRHDVSDRRVAAKPSQNWCEVEAEVPALKESSREVQGEDDPRVEELVLVGRVVDAPVPERAVEAQLRAEPLLEADVPGVMPLGEVVELPASELRTALDVGRRDRRRLRRRGDQDVLVLGR